MLKLSANAKCGITVTLGFASLAGISLAIQAASGLLAWHASCHAFFSPEYYCSIALTAGAIAGLGCSLGLGLKTIGTAFTTLGLSLSLGLGLETIGTAFATLGLSL